MSKISTLKRAGYASAAAALILSAVPVFPSGKAWAVPASCEGVYDGTEFASAITDGESTITLCADVAWTGEIASDLELDLNGKTLSTDRIQLASGDITITGGSITGTDTGKATLINNGANLTINRVNITSAGEKATIRADGGTTEINGGTIYGAGNALNARNAQITINDATITGGELLNNIVIYGGVYKMDPTAFVADDYDAYELEDPYGQTYWRVAEEAEITPVDPVVLPVGVEGDFVTVTPAEYNILSFDNYGEAVITMDSANGTATISNDNAVEETITITNNSGKSVDATARFYGIGEIDDVLLPVGFNHDLDIEITKEWDGDVDWSIVDYDDTIISVNGKTITGVASGSTTVTVEFDDSVATTREFTVYVYDLDTDAETIMLQAGGESAVIVADSNWEATTATSGSNILTITPDENTFEVSASNNGTATITLTISPDGDTEITKTITVYAYKVAEIAPVFVEKGDESGYLNISVSKPNVISYTISTEDSGVATVRSAQFGRNHRARGVDVGKTAILATFSMDGVESQTVKVGEVTVYDFNNNIANNYDIASGDEFTFTAEEANANGQISVETDTGKLTISQDGGVFTVKADDDIEAGSYRVTVTDTISDEEAGTEKVVETVTFNVRVHEITVSGDAERYVSLDNASVLGESFSVTVREKNNYSRTRDIRATVSGTPTGGVNVNRGNNGNFRITVSKAGSYAVTFSDSVASTTIYIYALNLNLEQTTYHVKAGDTAIKFINAMNEYWHSVNVNASLIDTEFISSTNENILAGFTQNTEEGQKYLLAIGNVEAGDYKLVFRAYANGNKTTYSEKSVTVRVYEMVAPEETSYYAYTGDQLNIEVTDKNSHAYTRAVVEEGDADGLRFNRRTNGNLRNFNVTARRAGVYKVRYTDYMENGEVVDEFVATIIVVEVEELNNVIVRKGNTKEFTGNIDWDATTAENITTGDDLTIEENEEGEMVAVFDSADLEPGKYTVEVSHEFEDGVSMVVKRANIIVYEILTDSENDPEGVIADTIEQYLNSLVESGKIDELLETSNVPIVGPIIDLARIATLLTDDTTTSTLGNGFEGLSGLLGLHDTLNDGTSISTRVNVRPFDEEDEIDEELADYITSLGYNIEDLMFFDVTVMMSDGTDDFGVLHELTKEITFVLCEVSEPQDGYTREWVVIRQHNGVSEVLPATKFFVKDGKLYVSSSEFSTYAVTFEDTKIPEAPDTGTYTAESKSHVDTAGILATAMMMALVGVALKDALAKRYSNKN
ncbi:hypothetical protein IKF12_00790 [Candidatus Saccharibacteria bacterium]|nr:hypothetical protein [Candidatus Saccharibacteria bacterium]